MFYLSKVVRKASLSKGLMGKRSQVGPEHSRHRRSKCKGPEVECGMSLLCLRMESMAVWLGQREQGR